MPWELRQRDDKWCVVKKGTDDSVPGGCHDSRDEALAHQRALYAAEPGARTAALADPFPLDPPEEWFTEIPDWFTPGMKATLITDGPDAGRIAATVAARGTFILSGTGDKWRSPPSPSNYEEAHQGDTYTASGHVVRTANLAMDTNHVPIHASYERARDLMAHTGTAVARVRYMDVGGHTVALGAAWPGLSDLQVRKLQASALSGDWRWREEYGGYDMAGSVVVNNPALPLKGDRPVFQPYAMAASLGLEHPPIYGSWVCDDEGVCQLMPPEPSVNLTLGAADVAALHRVLTNPAILAAITEPAAPCACGGHAAAAGDQQLAEAVAPEMGAPTREEFDALARQVEELQGQIMSDALADVDGMVAALPLPPDLEDEHRWAMPAAFDEAKHPRKPRGMAGGGRFAELIRELAAEPGRVDPADPRLDEAAEAGGTSKGIAAQQVNVTKRRIENGTEEAFQKQLADSESLLEDEDILDAMGGGKAMPPDVRERLAQAVDAIDETPGLVDESPELADFVERATLLLQRSETGSLVNA